MTIPFWKLVLLSTLIVSIIPATPLIASTQIESSIDSASSRLGSIGNQGVRETDPSVPGPDLGLANWTSNRFGNPSFESWSSPTSPDRWWTWAPGDSYSWYASAPWPVGEGTQSGGMQCLSPTGQYTQACWYQSSIGADMRNLTLTLDWYLDQNNDVATNYFYVSLHTYDPSYGSRYLQYILNGTQWWGNSSSQAMYKANGPSQQWNVFSRNLTKDFVSNQPYFPSAIPAGLVLQNIYIYSVATGGTNRFLRSFVDDVSLVNETNAYVWIGGGTRNGNWETSSDWGHYGNTDACIISQSSVVHSGSWSANITAASHGDSSYGELDAWPPVRMTAQNPGVLSFWWYLEYQQFTFGSQSAFYMGLYDGTHYLNVYYWLGFAGSGYANSSQQLCLKVEGFNTTSTWMHCVRDVWADAAAYFGADELFLDYCCVFASASGAGSRTVLLIDEASLEAGAVNGAGFEDQRAVGSRVRGFGGTYTEYNELTVTDTAYAGSKACNFTLTDGAVWSIGQELNWRPLNGTRETYLDAVWRLEDYTPTSGNFAYVRVNFQSGQSLYYFLASYGGVLPSNTSGSGYFNVTGASTMHVWVQMHRDLVHDYEAVFGALPHTEITSLYLFGTTSVGERLELLLDDLYLYDDPAPSVTNVLRVPMAPGYLQTVQVTAHIVDQDLNACMLHYRVNSSAWQHVVMSFISGSTYEAAIPGQPYDTLVEYYLTANDTWGKTTTALNGGVYWSYTIPAATTTTTTTTPPPIPGFPFAAIALALGVGLSLGIIRRRHRH